MGKTSAAVKNRYIEKAYDRINLTVPKGEKAKIQSHAESKGESVNRFIYRAINETIERDESNE
ncbi:MAG: antitoxin [Clostridiales bacterium]|nr:antitoxin [Clostridiales bacterium]